jgi:hypothetical protein
MYIYAAKNKRQLSEGFNMFLEFIFNTKKGGAVL